MTRPVECSTSEPAIHVALSSIELSILGIVAFDPDALPAIRAGQRISTIDADDSGMLRHAVPLDAWPEALWRAMAGTIVGFAEPAASQVYPERLYAARTIPDPADRSLLVSLTAHELAEGLRATYPDAEQDWDRIGARIRCLDSLVWSHDPIAMLPREALSDNGWIAAGKAIPDPFERDRWSPDLRIARRSTIPDDSARQHRAALRLRELHAALHLSCEMPAGGFDVAGYHENLIATLLTDPIACAMLAEDERAGGELEIIRCSLDEAGYGWRPAEPSQPTAAIVAQAA